jgi:hypothetical protein
MKELSQSDPYIEANNLCAEYEQKFDRNCPLTQVIAMFREERTRLLQLLSNRPSQISVEIPALKQLVDEALDQTPEARTAIQKEAVSYGIVEIVRFLVKKRLNL